MPLSFFAIVPDSNANLPLVIAIMNDGSSEILSNFSTRNSESLSKVKIELSIKETTIEESEPIFILSWVKIWSNAFNSIRSSTTSLFTLPSTESTNPMNFFSASSALRTLLANKTNNISKKLKFFNTNLTIFLIALRCWIYWCSLSCLVRCWEGGLRNLLLYQYKNCLDSYRLKRTKIVLRLVKKGMRFVLELNAKGKWMRHITQYRVIWHTLF